MYTSVQVEKLQSALTHATISVKIFHESLLLDTYPTLNPAVYRESLEAIQTQAFLQCRLGMFNDGIASWKTARDRADRYVRCTLLLLLLSLFFKVHF